MKKIAFFLAISLLLLKAESYDETWMHFKEVAQISDFYDNILNENALIADIERQIAFMSGGLIELDNRSKQGLMQITKEFLQTIKPEFEDGFYKIVRKYYTQGDLQELIAFYRTEVGKKALRFQSEIMNEGAKMGEQIFIKHQAELREKLQKLLE